METHADERQRNSGDVPATHAQTDELEEAIGFTPTTSSHEGLARFTEWLLDYRSRR